MANRAAHIRNENMGRTVTRRGRRYVEFDMGGGQRRFVATIEPLHYGAAANQEIDTTWEPTTGAWQWQLTRNDWNAYARNVLNAGDTIQWLDTRSGESVTLQPLALNWVDNSNDSRQQIAIPGAVTATADDCTLTWINGYGAGRHFRYTAHPQRLLKEFIIDSMATLPAPTVANPYLEVEFVLKRSSGVTLFVDGQSWDNSTKRATASAVEFRTASGQVVWQFDAPVATDAAGNTTPGIMQLRRQGANRYVTVRFDKAWIDAAVFPIALDPTLTDGYGGDVTTYKDTWIYQGAATTNYGTATVLQLGKNGTDAVRALFEFDLSSIAATATCNSATFTTQFLSNENYSATSIEVYELLSGRDGWTEAGATWNNYAAGSAWTTAGCGSTASDRSATSIGSLASTTPGSHNVSLTSSAVENWFGATNQNYGFLFRALVETDWERMEVASSDHATTSYRPVLVVDYTEGGGGITGSADITLAALTVSGAGQVEVTGDAALTLAALTAAGAGSVAVAGSLTQTLDALAVSASGAVAVAGAAGVTLAAVTVAGVGAVRVAGQADNTLDALTASGAGVVLVTGQAAAAPASLSASGEGAVLITGQGAVALEAVTLTAAGVIGTPPILGQADITLGSLTAQGAGVVAVTGAAAVVLAGLAASGAGAVLVTGAGAVELSPMTLVGAGYIGEQAPAPVVVVLLLADTEVTSLTLVETAVTTLMLAESAVALTLEEE